MRLLILTQYYPPETGAAQNRLHALAKRLSERGVEVKVLTAMPNYPAMKVMEGYRRRCFKRETIDGIEVLRSWIYVRNSKSIIQRLFNYFSFVFSSFNTGLFRLGRTDYILCESPPLFLGITAFFLSRIKRAGLIFNVSDLWPESAEKLGLIHSRFLLGISTRLEEFLYRRSVLITGQTRGIVDNIKKRFPQKPLYWLPNGAELDYYTPGKDASEWRKDNGFEPSDFLVFYGGILGHAQGLEVLLEAAGRLREHTGIKVIIMGDGPLKEKMLQMKASLGLFNVFFFGSVPKSQMPLVLSSIDISVIPLKKLDLFKGAIPSKIFENLAMKKPILLGVEGEAKSLFIDEGKCGLAFEPENDAMLAEKILLLRSDPSMLSELGNNARAYAELRFDRNKIADDFYDELIKLYEPKSSTDFK
ncbi:MAG TPA: glycosyltransferase family 4 protein [Bacteroidales bacterium]|nr:glycosyltransferase family 4 protein [Bacteroidales bacterium]